MTNDSAAAAVPGPGGNSPSGPSSSGPSSSDGFTVVLPSELADAAGLLFGERLRYAHRYAELLATEGVLRGLIGPREAPRIWDRHLLNCAAVAELIPSGATVLDVGSGAGLPGIVLAMARPDLTIGLIEPLARRTAFLSEVVEELDLAGRVRVIRARAEDARSGLPELLDRGDDEPGDIVTARAVAPIDRLAGWCLPLVGVGGRLLALKGASAVDEIAEHGDRIRDLGGGSPVVRRCGVGLIDPPTTVVEITRDRLVPDRATRRAAASRAAGAGRTRRGRRPGQSSNGRAGHGRASG